MVCGACGEPSPEGKRFCAECGAALLQTCGTCGATSEPGKRFCGDCGAALGPTATPPAAAAPEPATGSPSADRVAERRLTSVLFGDLVGFTTISETRDPEEVRELLSRYFQVASTIVGRYGGTVEKFIGDAVMAVWGVPVAREDDAERAVRAGLDLVEAVTALGHDVGVDELAMRVGVLTGEVAVTLGAANEGMVAGDAVNTAARIQATAAPGEVWVDETTRGLTAGGVAYRDAGDHVLKGKADAVRLHVADRVVASVGGAQRIDGLEATFTGRDRELRLVKELFLGAIDERRPRLIALSGPAGVGKTRLSWELERYVDGLAETILWHRSRALSYGEGVTFWPFAEMVRSRLGIVDGDPPSRAAERLDAGLLAIVPDATERQWIRPRLAALLGLAADGAAGFPRGELFAAWTAFLERVGQEGIGVVCVFDDMQHADPGLLDLIEHLVDAGDFPLVVVTMARPDLLERRPGWGTARRSTPLHLEPLGAEAMAAIADDLVDGLPAAARDELVARSEGIPLYALELVRSLIDRDVVVPQEGRYVLADTGGDVREAIAASAPPSLHALVAARLDALSPDERRLVQDASVIGEVFSRDELAEVSAVEDVDTVLAELRRKEIVAVQADRFSTERGQYRFVQALVRSVALDTLSRRDRKARHLAVARLLEGRGDELAAVVSRHLLDAVDCAPGDPDVEALAARAAGHLQRAAKRAESLGVPEEAARHYRLALSCRPDELTAAHLLEGLGRAEHTSGDLDAAFTAGTEAAAAFRALGEEGLAARATAIAGSARALQGELQVAIELMTPVYEQIEADADTAPDALQTLGEELARAHFALDRVAEAAPYADRALVLAERAGDWDAVVRLLSRHATIWGAKGLYTGSEALTEAAVQVGREHGCTSALVIPLSNLGVLLTAREPRRAMEAMQEGITLAQQAGAKDLERVVAATRSICGWVLGAWEQILETDRTSPKEGFAMRNALHAMAQQVLIERGQLDRIDLAVHDTATIDDRSAMISAMHLNLQAAVASGEGDVAAAATGFVLANLEVVGVEDDTSIMWAIGADAALAAGDHAAVEELVVALERLGEKTWPPLLRLQVDRVRAGLAEVRGEPAEALELLAPVAEGFDAIGSPYYAAKARLAAARCLRATGGPDDEVARLLASARAGFDALGAAPGVAAVDALLTGVDAA